MEFCLGSANGRVALVAGAAVNTLEWRENEGMHEGPIVTAVVTNDGKRFDGLFLLFFIH